MSYQLNREEIGAGIHFSSVTDLKFKHNRLSVNIIMPLEEQTASDNAVVPFILRKGCRECPDFTSLNTRLCELYGAVLDADVTKYGAYQVLGVAIQGLDNRFALEREDIAGECAALLASVVLDPNLDEKGLFQEQDTALEKQFILDTIQAEINDKRVYAMSRCKQEMCKGEPVAVRRYGGEKTAGAITPASAAKAYRRMLEQGRIEVMFSGSGDPGAAREIFKERFAGVKRKTFDYALPALRGKADKVQEVTEQMELNQAKLVMGFRTGGIKTTEQVDAMRMCSALFGGTPFSKLFLNVREKLSLCYYCACRFDVSTRLLTVDSGVEDENRAKAREEILRQLKAVQEGHITDEELANTKLLMRNSVTSVTDSLSSIEGWYLTQIIRGQGVSPQEDAANLEAVTKEQVIQAAKGISLDTIYTLTGQASRKEEQ